MKAGNTPKKILFVITKATGGGAQEYVYRIAKASKASGYSVSVAYGHHGLLLERLDEAGIHTIHVSGLDRDMRVGNDLRAYRELRAIFKYEKPDIIHLNSSKAGLLGSIAALGINNVRVLFTSHGWAFNEQRSWWQKTLLKIASGCIVLLTEKTICVSNAVERDMRWLPFSSRKLKLIPLGRMKCALYPKIEARENLIRDQIQKRWIGVISELHPTKRVDDIIVAFAKIHNLYPDTILVILGSGEEHARLLEKIDALHLKDSVFLLGFVQDAARYVLAFDIFVQASISEALGYSILEAGAGSLPVLATKVGGIPEIIENNVTGFLVPPKKPDEIARGLRTLLEDKELSKRLGEALQERVMRDFSIEAMIESTLNCYR